MPAQHSSSCWHDEDSSPRFWLPGLAVHWDRPAVRRQAARETALHPSPQLVAAPRPRRSHCRRQAGASSHLGPGRRRTATRQGTATATHRCATPPPTAWWRCLGQPASLPCSPAGPQGPPAGRTPCRWPGTPGVAAAGGGGAGLRGACSKWPPRSAGHLQLTARPPLPQPHLCGRGGRDAAAEAQEAARVVHGGKGGRADATWVVHHPAAWRTQRAEQRSMRWIMQPTLPLCARGGGERTARQMHSSQPPAAHHTLVPGLSTTCRPGGSAG